VEALNRHMRDGTFARPGDAREAAYGHPLPAAARAILDTRGTRLVIVAGPCSSGKTTTTTRLTQLLHEGGMQVQPLTLDNYFFDLHLHPRDASGDPDYETPEALDLQLVNEHLAALLAGREIAMPIYDFKLGRRLDETRKMRLHPDQCLLLDTLHGMYEPLTRSVGDDVKFRVYIETVLQLRDQDQRWVRWTDLRLLRRMMRDAAHRNSDPASTVAHWHYVRRGELKHIIPNQSRADFVLNGALPYELPVFKRHLAQHFPRFVTMWRDDRARADALGRARRIGALLDAVLPADDACVPPTSVLREFIGGSAFDVH
jgi:uridine kinase